MKRIFEKITKYKDEDLIFPKRSTKLSAGYDLASAKDEIIKPNDIVFVETGFKAKFPKNEVLLIFARSSLPFKKRLMLVNGVGVIDSDYYNSNENEGHILVPLINLSNEDVIINKGERLVQGIFTKFKKVSREYKINKKRNGGFGSSGLI